MNVVIKRMLVKYYESVTLVGEALSYLILFGAGLCRYRIILFLSIAGIVRVIANAMSVGKDLLNIVIVTIALPFIYMDLSKGQLYPIFPNMSVIVSAGALIITVVTINTYLKKLVQKITCNEIFTYCLNCKFENIHLVKECRNCRSRVVDFKDIDNEYEKPKSLLNFINGECVIAMYHFGKLRGVYKNGTKLQTKEMIITNLNIVFVHYKYNCKGWSSKEIINNENITQIIIEKKKHNRITSPIMTIIESNGNKYELFYYAADSAYIKLNEIADCIKNQNNSIEILFQ